MSSSRISNNFEFGPRGHPYTTKRNVRLDSGHYATKYYVHSLIFREDNCPLLRRQLYGAQFMVKITVFEKTMSQCFLVLKKTIFLEKIILPFPLKYYGLEYV